MICKNIHWSGPHEDVNYNGSEADIVVFLSDGDLNVQTLARAKRLLIILTLEKEWYHSINSILKLKNALALGLAEMMRLGYCPYEMIKCEQCESKFDEKTIYYHILEQCHVKCRNFGKGCEWKGVTRLHDYHLTKVCDYELEFCAFCNEISERNHTTQWEHCTEHTLQMLGLHFSDGDDCPFLLLKSVMIFMVLIILSCIFVFHVG